AATALPVDPRARIDHRPHLRDHVRCARRRGLRVHVWLARTPVVSTRARWYGRGVSALSPVRLIRLGAALLALAAFGSVFASAPPAPTGDNYVALGDSYSSGVGTGSYTLDAACKRSVYSYPYLYTQQHPGTTLSFVACSGAKTSDLLSKQVQALSGTTTLVTMTIGGNDIGFANLIYPGPMADLPAPPPRPPGNPRDNPP